MINFKQNTLVRYPSTTDKLTEEDALNISALRNRFLYDFSRNRARDMYIAYVEAVLLALDSINDKQAWLASASYFEKQAEVMRMHAHICERKP